MREVLKLCGLFGGYGLPDVDKQDVGSCAGNVEKPEGGADVFAMQAVAVGSTVAGLNRQVFE